MAQQKAFGHFSMNDQRALDLLNRFTPFCHELLQTLGCVQKRDAHRAVALACMRHILEVSESYRILYGANDLYGSRIMCRCALECVFKIRALEQRPDCVVRMLKSDLLEERKHVRVLFGECSEQTNSIDSESREIRSILDPVQQVEYDRINCIESLYNFASLGRISSFYDTRYRLFSKFVHGSIRASLGGYDDIDLGEERCIAFCLAVACDGALKLGGTVSNVEQLDILFKDFERYYDEI